MSTPEELESEADFERAIEAADGWMTAQVDLECPVCGLPIHEGQPIVLGPISWVHPLCDVETFLDIEAQHRHDRDRERGL